jgi:hypothetical protein
VLLLLLLLLPALLDIGSSLTAAAAVGVVKPGTMGG